MYVSKKNVKESGQSLVELALSLIFLAILLGVVVDGGLAFFNWITLRDAAQEGAIYAAMNPTDVAVTGTRARASSTDPILQDANINVSYIGSACRGITSGVANGVTVEVTYFYTFITPFFRPAGWAGVNIRASATNTILNPPCP